MIDVTSQTHTHLFELLVETSLVIVNGKRVSASLVLDAVRAFEAKNKSVRISPVKEILFWQDM